MNKILWDIGVSAVIMAAAGLVYWEALKYKPGTYDPLGSGAMPRMVAIIIAVLCVVAIAQALLASVTNERPKAARESFVRRPRLAVAIFVYLVICTALVYARVPFSLSSSIMLFASIMTIRRGERAMILPAAACSLAFGFGLTFLFAGLFGVDLP